MSSHSKVQSLKSQRSPKSLDCQRQANLFPVRQVNVAQKLSNRRLQHHARALTRVQVHDHILARVHVHDPILALVHVHDHILARTLAHDQFHPVIDHRSPVRRTNVALSASHSTTHPSNKRKMVNKNGGDNGDAANDADALPYKKKKIFQKAASQAKNSPSSQKGPVPKTKIKKKQTQQDPNISPRLLRSRKVTKTN